MSRIVAWGWIVVGVVAWVLLAAVVAVLIGRMLRFRDLQVPRIGGADRPAELTDQRAVVADEELPSVDEPGHGRRI